MNSTTASDPTRPDDDELAAEAAGEEQLLNLYGLTRH